MEQRELGEAAAQALGRKLSSPDPALTIGRRFIAELTGDGRN
jgi:hypothetical protein